MTNGTRVICSSQCEVSLKRPICMYKHTRCTHFQPVSTICVCYLFIFLNFFCIYKNNNYDTVCVSVLEITKFLRGLFIIKSSTCKGSICLLTFLTIA
jgi:hypothetical protein